MKYLLSIIGFALVIMFQTPVFASNVDLTMGEMKLIHRFESHNKLYNGRITKFEYEKVMQKVENPGTYKHISTRKLGVYRDGNGELNVKYRLFGKYIDTSFGGWENQHMDITVIYNVTDNTYWISDPVYKRRR